MSYRNQRPSIKKDITKRRLKWAGHSWRKTGSLVKIVQENAPKGKRPLGRPSRESSYDKETINKGRTKKFSRAEKICQFVLEEDIEKVRPGLDWKELTLDRET
ncbi:putative transposon-derived protein F52C9.6 [Aphis craccivora]|uniref:Putative transposon-derived protein F52C9.6 n=1 Tax=Aphis craccivora TaxID=307492 RepID=A0A6G0Z320_APHCR|nr:putative transposon-derived protein F52C9.6 [Aphis craccivora]